MKTITIDPSKPFQFLEVKDYGYACCPHCGAEGRYIYSWAEYGQVRSAMAGCYAGLTGQVKKDDYSTFMEVLSRKQAQGKPLNGWQKTVLRMQQFIADGRYSEDWCNQKIKEAISQQKQYAFKRGH